MTVAEDSLLVREGIAKLLAAEEDFEVAALCADFDELMASVDHSEPDVVITDIRMPPTGTDEGIRAAIELRTSHPSVGVVVLSQYIDASYAVALFDAGSEGRAYLLKERGLGSRRVGRCGAPGGRRRVGDRPQGGGGAGHQPVPSERIAAALPDPP